MAGKKKKVVKKRGKKVEIVVGLFLLGLAIFFFSYILLSSNQTSVVRVPSKPEGKVLPLPNKSLLGISLYDTDLTPLIDIEKKLNSHFNIVGIYQSWGSEKNTFNLEWATEVVKNNSIPMITWEPWDPISGFDRSEHLVDQEDYRLKNITEGKFDLYIREYAKDTAAFKKQVIIRFAHEMNGNWYSWGSKFNTPAEYISMWRNVHAIFQEEGATNATWVWSPNQIYEEDSVPFSDNVTVFYPGGDVVDWVGLSGFNWAGAYKANTWIEPQDLYGPTVEQLLPFNKPIMITETASAESFDGHSKALWIKNLGIYLKKNSVIKALVWFHVEDNGINWKIDSTPKSEEAFKETFSPNQ